MTRKLTLIALAVIGSLFITGSALAVDVTAPASVDILAPLSVANTVPMSFGDIVPPTIVDQDFVMATDGSVNDSAADGDQLGVSTAATFTVQGTNGGTAGLTLSIPTPMDGTGVTLSALQSNPGASLALDGTSQTVDVGGTLTVTPTASTGTHTATIQLAVVYQ